MSMLHDTKNATTKPRFCYQKRGTKPLKRGLYNRLHTSYCGIWQLKNNFSWDGKGTSYPPQADQVYDHETVSRTKEVVGLGYPSGRYSVSKLSGKKT
jgi:hypothetical protein